MSVAVVQATLDAVIGSAFSYDSAMNFETSSSKATLRSLVDTDFEAVVGLDSTISGRSRRAYFERRLKAALQRPHRHVQIAATEATTDSKLIGFVLARRMGGEFGQRGEALVLDTVGVEPNRQHQGVGRRLLSQLEDLAVARDISRIVTQAGWDNHAMLRFLDGAGFLLSPSHVLTRRVHRMPLPETDEEVERMPPLVRLLKADDLAAIVRIDREITGRDHHAYLARKVDEALYGSAIAVSLVVEDDGFVAGYAMSHVDHGNFGHIEATASLETIGIKPSFTKRGLARALLTQMIDNLSAIDVERIDVEVAYDNLKLQQFLYRFGFAPSQRLSFQKVVRRR